MSHPIKEWVAAAPDARQRELRQAVHTVLVAVSEFRQAGLHVVMKGGILLAVEYDGDRYTKDVDFSTTARVADISPERFADTLNSALAGAAERLEYGLDCRVQSFAQQPPGEDKSWPTLQIKVGYAPMTDAARHGRLARGQATTTVAVEISYNEVITASEVIHLGDGLEIEASTLADLAAEKYRAMIQQPVRNRVRRQDAYDLYCLLETHGPRLEVLRDAVREALLRKSEGRGLTVDRDALRNPDVERRSRAEYPQLKDEIRRALPEFAEVYGKVRAYFEGMGW
jgi:predicted nucleotidyltransferase component of viral defense system